MRSRRIAGIVRMLTILLMVGSGIGFVATLMLGAFVLDRYDAYGEVPIPGTAKLHLPAGPVTVNFHTVTVGNSSGGGLPVPNLVLDIDPPAGVANPKVTESVGGSTSVNNDIHRRVWVAQIPVEGDYIITTSGEVNGFISPRMAFGHDSDSNHAWPGICAGVFVVGLVGTIITSVWRSRAKPRESASPPWQASTPAVDQPVVIPSDQGVKIEQLKTLAALRDSGALTEKEFQDEKRRVLDGD
jgi:putative oligomerization/nucleic acid binding protein